MKTETKTETCGAESAANTWQDLRFLKMGSRKAANAPHGYGAARPRAPWGPCALGPMGPMGRP